MNLKIVTKILALMMLCVCMCACGFKEKEKGKGQEKAPASHELSDPSADSSDTKGDADIRKGRPTVIDFYATWCPPCKKIAPMFEMLKSEYSDKIEFMSVDVDEDLELTTKYKVQAMPTFVILDADGKEIKRIVGADGEALSTAVDKLVAK